MKPKKHHHALRRCLSMLLTVALFGTLLPSVTLTAEAAWGQEYIDTLVEWGVLRDDIEGETEPTNYVTRADFIAMVNRAFGYTEVGETPFTDVWEDAWYAEDIAIAYTAGYFKGTGDGTTASPNSYLTREQAVVIFGRNLALPESTGEVLGFSDSRDFSVFSRSMVEPLVAEGIITGYPDGLFRPKNKITRAQASCMLIRALGTLINESDDVSLGGVYSNVTISTSGVALRDTTIAGNLYLTGGIGLGDVLLENVTVLGKIVVCGGGESSSGECSVVLRNVNAEEMIVQNLAGQFLTISADGDTSITTTSVQTSAYLQDLTTNAAGLQYISFDAEDGSTLTLAGGINAVTNYTANSTINVAQGCTGLVTVDEVATNSTLNIENGAYAESVKLDIATTIIGTGDVTDLTVNAAGVTSEILPDSVTVRPGLTAGVAGETMDTTAAMESSSDPRLLSGYPSVKNIAPTTAQAVFSSNKSGTVYWAVTAVADGSVDEDDLISPPTYGGKILSSGNTAITSSTEVTVSLSKLTAGGSYYLSAILVDNRGQRSPIKVVSFSTPDDSTPAFSSGYPYMSKITSDSAQVTIMTTKSCQLYYAVLPKGASAPTAAEFKANGVSGNLGYGSMSVAKSIPAVFYVNKQALDELADYDLYLWLTDFDGAKSSAVKKLSFTTVDGTPPIFVTEPYSNAVKATSVGLKATLNEKGTVYWVVVTHGEEYPKPLAGQTAKPSLDSETAKLQVVNGMNCLKSGKVSAGANKDMTISVSGLAAETAYDFYYVAVDDAGNYSATVKMITINTLDTVPPTVSLSFSSTADETGDDPMPDTDLILTFSEGIQSDEGFILVDLYNTIQNGTTQTERDEATTTLTEILTSTIALWDASSYPHTQVGTDRSAAHWIDYSKAEVKMVDGKTVITFAHSSGVQLKSGGTYYFKVSDLYDTSNNKNKMKVTQLDTFTTVFAQATLTNEGIVEADYPFARNEDGTINTSENARVDMSFRLHPVSTENVDDSIYYDVFLWTDSYLSLDLYVRAVDRNTGDPVTNADAYFATLVGTDEIDDNGWIYLGNSGTMDGTTNVAGISVRKLKGSSFSRLNQMNPDYTYEYAISLTMLDDLYDYQEWSDKVTIGVTVPAGQRTNVHSLSNLITEENWRTFVNAGLTSGGVRSIGTSRFSVSYQFEDTKAPTLDTVSFLEGDTFVTMTFQLNRSGTVYYVLAPVTEDKTGGYNYTIKTEDSAGDAVEPSQVPNGTTDKVTGAAPTLSTPTKREIYSPGKTNNTEIKTGNLPVGRENAKVTVSDLEPETTYYLYLVTKGESENYSEVALYRFKTEPAGVPAITLSEKNPSVIFETNVTSDLDYALISYDSIPNILRQNFYEVANDTYATVMANFETSENKRLDTDVTSFSVLDAMLTNCVDSAGVRRTVFDVYAQTTVNGIRDQVAQYIRERGSDSTDNAKVRGSLSSLTGETTTLVDFSSYMEENVQYFCLTVAHNIKGTTDGFAAIRNIQIPDKTAPYFVSAITSGADKPDSDGTYSGTLILTFSEPLYLIQNVSGDKVAVPLWYSKKTDGLEDPDNGNYVYFHNHITKSDFTLKSSRNINGVTDTIELTFSKVKSGDVLILFSGGVTIADEAGNTAVNDKGSAKRLTLTFVENVDTQVGYVTMKSNQFVATWE